MKGRVNLLVGEKEVQCCAGGSAVAVDVADVISSQRAEVTGEGIGMGGMRRGCSAGDMRLG